MIAIGMPATVRRDRSIGLDTTPTWKGTYAPVTLLMLFADEAELALVQSIFNGGCDCEAGTPAPTGIRHAWFSGTDFPPRADEEARDPSCRLGGDHRCREADGSPLTVIDDEVSFGSVCAEWARRDSRPEDAA